MQSFENAKIQFGPVDKYWGAETKNIKKQPFGDAKRIKTARLRRKTNLQKFKFALNQIKRCPNAFNTVGKR